jgi:hypothetical protein
MADVNATTKKRNYTRRGKYTPRNRAPVTGTLIGVRLQAEELQRLDDARYRIFPPPSRPEMLRRFLKEAT